MAVDTAVEAKTELTPGQMHHNTQTSTDNMQVPCNTADTEHVSLSSLNE